MNKTAISTAIAAALGLSVGVAHAAAVTGFTIKDVGSNTANGIGNYSATLDGRSGAFRFNSTYINVATYAGTSSFTGDVGTGTMLAGVNATGSFSTGFLFSSAPFTPFTYGTGFQADITGGVTTVSSMNFGGNYGGSANFNLPPDATHPLQVLWTVATANSSDYYVAVRWGHDITTADDPSLTYTAFTAQWVLEGCMSTVGHAGAACGAPVSAVPVPAAVWLFGSGLVGLAGIARRKKKKA